MGGGAGADAIIAPDTAFQVDDHGLGTVHVPVIDSPLHQVIIGRRPGGQNSPRIDGFLHGRENVTLQDINWNPDHIHVTERGQRVEKAEFRLTGVLPSVVELTQTIRITTSVRLKIE